MNPEFAQKFIQRTVKNLPYNVNIMDQSGIIIASKDASRIGDFHEVASKMLNGTIDTGVVTKKDHYIGTKPGINMFIEHRGEKVGVICVTGDPENVQSFAGFVKTSIETMLDYELQAAQEHRSRGKTERFLYYLLFNDDYNSEEAVRLAREFNLDERTPAVIILLRKSHRIPNSKILPILTKGAETHNDRIAVVGRNDDIIILKLFRSGNTEYLLRNFKTLMQEYLDSVLSSAQADFEEDELVFFIGSLQEKIDNYRDSYKHALKNSMLVKKKQQLNYFYDHIQDYIRNSVTTRLYFEAFSIYQNLFDTQERKIMVETIRTLSENNYNIVKTSQDLCVHRNTIVFRLNKLKDLLQIDPITNSADREFLTELGFFLEKC